MADVKALRALLDAATPGPWEVRGQMAGDGALRVETVLKARGMRAAGDPYPAVCRLPRDYSMQHADAALIAGAVNALPELLDEVERLKAAIADAERWAAHSAAGEVAALGVIKRAVSDMLRIPVSIEALAVSAIRQTLSDFRPSVAGSRMLDRLHAIETERDALRAEVERMKARECPKCGGSGGVITEGEK